jgi:hypothetical protein
VLATPIVRSVYIRRSVAAGEAAFPFSDLDLAIVVEPAAGTALNQLRRRFALARLAFPRLGECQVFAQEDLDELAVTDPYRTSLDRRTAVAVFGPPPSIPEAPVPVTEVARRFITWFDGFIPTARRTGNQRNLRKFAVELTNALGVLEGRWPLPLTSRRETVARTPLPTGDLFTVCCELAVRAHARLRPPAPVLSTPLDLGAFVVAPLALAVHLPPHRTVMTPEVLDLLLQYQRPWLWYEHGEPLAAAGFDAPDTGAWLAAARRYAGGERVRGPGFLERRTGPAVARLKAAASVLGADLPALPPSGTTPATYYLAHYDTLAAWAATLRARASRLLRA